MRWSFFPVNRFIISNRRNKLFRCGRNFYGEFLIQKLLHCLIYDSPMRSSFFRLILLSFLIMEINCFGVEETLWRVFNSEAASLLLLSYEITDSWTSGWLTHSKGGIWPNLQFKAVHGPLVNMDYLLIFHSASYG
jgi:hypothetical protein